MTEQDENVNRYATEIEGVSLTLNLPPCKLKKVNKYKKKYYWIFLFASILYICFKYNFEGKNISTSTP